MKVTKQKFGVLSDGTKVNLFTVKNDNNGYFIKYKIGSIDHFTNENKEVKTTEEFIEELL